MQTVRHTRWPVPNSQGRGSEKRVCTVDERVNDKKTQRAGW